MIAVTFALPEESRDLRARLHHAGRLGLQENGILLGNLGAHEVVLAHTGMGAARAQKKIAALLAVVQPEFLIASGFAGGLDPRLQVGDLLLAVNYSAPELLAAAAAAYQDGSGAVFQGGLFTAPAALESVEEKAKAAAETGALAVDMETAGIAEACATTGTPLLAARAISDAAADALPVPGAEWFDQERQRPRPLALLRYLARNSRQISPFARFVHGLTPARRTLTSFLLRFLAQPF